jgi:GNAT superfamily N-acetyltransferase
MCAAPMTRTSAITFAWGTISQARLSGIEDLIALNWEEVEDVKTVSPLAIDWASYRQLENQKVLRVGLMRHAGRLVGYNIFFVKPTLHSRDTIWAVNDLVYLDPEYRLGLNGVRLIVEAEELLRKDGVKVILYGAKPSRDLGETDRRGSVAQLLQKLGYGAFDTSWVKALGGAS